MRNKTKPTLLYTSTLRNSNWRRAIAYSNSKYEYSYANQIIPPFQLDEYHGVVFVGPQTSRTGESVFRNYADYFGFVEEAHNKGLKIAAVLNPPCILPKKNKGIDYIVDTSETDGTIASIARELTIFFDKY